MRKLLMVLVLLSLVSCGKANKTAENQKLVSELQAYKLKEIQIENTKRFITDYLKDVNSSNWRSKLPKYLPSRPDKFLKEHAAFRESFPNYDATIKHLVVEGNEGIVWINVSGNYAKTYSLEDEEDVYGDSILRGIEAENQALSWDETWYFDVVNGKFGEKWNFLKDNYTVLEGLKVLSK